MVLKVSGIKYFLSKEVLTSGRAERKNGQFGMMQLGVDIASRRFAKHGEIIESEYIEVSISFSISYSLQRQLERRRALEECTVCSTGSLLGKPKKNCRLLHMVDQ